VLTDAAPTAALALAPLALVLAEATAATVFALAILPLVLAEATATAVFAPAPPPLVLADLAGLLGCSRRWRQSCYQARHIVWVHITLFVLAALSLWPTGCVRL